MKSRKKRRLPRYGNLNLDISLVVLDEPVSFLMEELWKVPLKVSILRGWNGRGTEEPYELLLFINLQLIKPQYFADILQSQRKSEICRPHYVVSSGFRRNILMRRQS